MMLDGLDIVIQVEDSTGGKAHRVITIQANRDCDQNGLSLTDIPTSRLNIVFGGMYTYGMTLSPVVAGCLRDKIATIVDNGGTVRFKTNEDRREIIASCLKLPESYAVWSEKDNRAVIHAPRTTVITDMMRKIQASPRRDGSWSIPVNTIRDFIQYNDQLREFDRVRVDESLAGMVSEPLPEPYDGTADSLRKLPLSVLRTVQANNQSWSAVKKNRGTIEEKFSSMGINNLYDLIMYRPSRYIDRSEPQDVRDLIEGEEATIIGTVKEWRQPSPRLNVMVLEDSRGMEISCSYFNASWIVDKYHVGDNVVAVGKYAPWKPSWGNSNRVYPQLAQPTIDLVEAAGALPIMPVYKSPGKTALTSATIMHCEQELINRLGDGFKGPAWTDEALVANHVTNESYGDALRTMHLPLTKRNMESAQSALAFCEMVQLLVWIEANRKGDNAHKGVKNSMTGVLTDAYIGTLPYALTGAQDRAVARLRKGFNARKPMRSLLVGDVGSGKTTVMHLAALMSVESGHQAVICAPTEILAQQLYDVFMSIHGRMPAAAQHAIRPVLHASYKGKGATARRRENERAVATGEANLIFGTHAVLNLEYRDLGFVGVDEQHKFGAKQRSRLLEVRDDGRSPDMMMQTATPIPRSMAQVYYGDVDYLRLDEMPAGRQPIVTEWVQKKGADVVNDPDCPIWSDVRGEIAQGHGVFIVCPMVTDSEKVDAASVKKTADVLSETVFSTPVMVDGAPRQVRLRTVYGGQDAKKQDEAILGFKNGDVDVLVASSVVEVGVSCEKATRMVILDASRFGLASLHQIRGRIGRSSLASKCWLVAMTFNDVASRRMRAMCDTLDGWRLSKTDLMNRGTGSLFSDRQSGKSDLVFADLVSDAKWIDSARRTALSLLHGNDAAKVVDDARRYFGLKAGQDTLA